MVRLDKAAESVESAPTSAQMFLAAAQLRSGRAIRKRQPLMVEAADGHLLSQDVHKASRIHDHFITQFNHKTTAVISKPCPHTFINPITDLEVSTAFHRMSNGKACGPDSVPSELLKYSPDELASAVASVINSAVARGDNLYQQSSMLVF